MAGQSTPIRPFEGASSQRGWPGTPELAAAHRAVGAGALEHRGNPGGRRSAS